MIQRLSWKILVLQYLMNYGETAHATNEMSPSELLHDRKMKTKLNLQNVNTTDREDTLICKRVEEKQIKWKDDNNKTRSSKDQ